MRLLRFRVWDSWFSVQGFGLVVLGFRVECMAMRASFGHI